MSAITIPGTTIPRSRLALGVAILALTIISLMADQLSLNLSSLVKLVSNQLDDYQAIVIWQWRLPRILTAILIGTALGVSGAIFQSLVRNPLGSPDVTGFNVGAFTGVLLTIAFVGRSFELTVLGAIGGGLFSALLVYLFAYRNGLSGFRLIIVGIAISAMLTAFNLWLSMTVSLDTAMTAQQWSAGSLNGTTWSKFLPSCLFIGMLLVFSSMVVTRMKLLEMGDDLAASLGVPINTTRILLMVLGVCLTAAPTAISGPIIFISLAAPQIAKRIDQSADSSLVSSGLMGAFLLLGADFIAQHIFVNSNLPVGLVTICLGGLYLLYLITKESKLS